jgi:hypothetical protein
MKSELMSPLKAKNIATLTLSDIEEMEAKEWSREAKERFSVDLDVDFDSLPLELQYREYIIDTTGSRKWTQQDFAYIDGSSIVHLYNDSGRMRYGTSPDRYCGTAGLREISGGGHTVENVNVGCFLVGVSDIFFHNTQISPYGASIGTLDISWQVGENQAGFAKTAVNDDYDRDNNGVFTQRLRVTPINVFAKLQRLLRSPFI